MLTRLLTALVLVSGVVSLIVLGPTWAIATLLIVVVALCFWEFHAMAAPDFTLDRVVGLVCCVTLLAAGQWGTGSSVAGAVSLFIWLPAFAVIGRSRPIELAGKRLATTWGGAVYIGGCGLLGLPLVQNPGWMLTGCIVIWLGDSAAYFVGRSLGRHKLHPTVSPNKTVEGAIGGFAGSVGGGLAGHLWLVPDVPLEACLVAGAVGGVLGPIGDLVESALKRACDVKDSGRLLPGHGGFLDRLDALLFVMPFFTLYGAHLGLVSL